MWNDLAKLYVACLVWCGFVHVQQACLNSTLTNLLPGAPPP